jgi:hypothetical protein
VQDLVLMAPIGHEQRQREEPPHGGQLLAKGQLRLGRERLA